MPDILLTIRSGACRLYYGDEALAGLRALGPVRVNETDEPYAFDALIAAAQGCAVIVSDRQTPGTAALFDALPDLCAFMRVAVDIRNVDVAAASRNGILVTHASAGFTAAVSELIVGGMIDLARNISASVMAYRAGATPDTAMGRQLKGSTIGIVGYGAIGRALADLALAFGMTVLVSDPHIGETAKGVSHVDMGELLKRADFVVCLAVATDATENLFDGAAFAAMKPDAFFINASRGNLVDETALLAALDTGRIAGAALDVGRAPDQMPSPRLAAHPRVIATPHIGGLTPAAVRHQAMESVRQCDAILSGTAPPGAVNAAAAHRLKRLARG